MIKYICFQLINPRIHFFPLLPFLVLISPNNASTLSWAAFEHDAYNPPVQKIPNATPPPSNALAVDEVLHLRNVSDPARGIRGPLGIHDVLLVLRLHAERVVVLCDDL